MSDQQSKPEEKKDVTEHTSTDEGWKAQLIKSIAGENETLKGLLTILLHDLTLGAVAGALGLSFLKGKGMAEELENLQKENKELKQQLKELVGQIEEMQEELKEIKAPQLHTGRRPSTELNGNYGSGKKRYSTTCLD
jgi:chromosome segregation ATPase